MTAAALYLRFSSAQQRPASIEDQRRRCTRACENRGWRIVAEEADAATSGSRHTRPGLDRLLARLDETPRPFNVVVVDDLSRLSRDIAHAVPLVFGRLADADVAVLDASTGCLTSAAEARMGTMIALICADAQLQSLRHQTARGLEGRVLRGGSAGGRRYGYRSEDDPACPGGRRLVIDEAEAAVVRRVFDAFASGSSLRAIARALTAEGIAGPREHLGARRGWSGGTVRSILTNTAYVGELVWARTRRVRAPGRGVWRKAPQPPDQQTRVDLPHLAIVEREVWDRAQQRLATDHARRGRPTGTGSPGSPLLGVLRCGACGAPCTTVGRKGRFARFGCSEKARKGPGACTGVRTLSEAAALPLLAAAITATLDGDDIDRLVAAELSRRGDDGLSARRLEAERRRALEREERRLVTALAACAEHQEAARSSILARLDEVSATLAALARSHETRGPPQVKPPTGTLLGLEAALAADPGRGREVLREAFGAVHQHRAPDGLRLTSDGPIRIELFVKLRAER